MNYCDRCDCEVSHLNISNLKSDEGMEIMVCDICYGSIVGNIIHWNTQYSSDVVTIAKMMAQVGNMILEKINSMPSEPSTPPAVPSK